MPCIFVFQFPGTTPRQIHVCEVSGCLFRCGFVRHMLSIGAHAPRDLLDNVEDADWNPDGSALAVVHEVGGKDRVE